MYVPGALNTHTLSLSFISHADNSHFQVETTDTPPKPFWWESLDTEAELEEQGVCVFLCAGFGVGSLFLRLKASFHFRTLAEPVLDDHSAIDSDSRRPVHAFSDRAEYAVYRITEILNQAHGSGNSNSSEYETTGPDDITEEQVDKINQIIDSLSEEERERVSELMELADDSPVPQ